MRDIRKDHQRRADDLSFDGWTKFTDCPSQDQFVALCKKHALPTGAIFLWAIGEIWAPPAKTEAGRAAA